jgi:predicted RNA-binding Zn-ribbon protein involved in translation (DUF1610 family)
MASGLSLSSAVEVFPCPHCGETINTSHSSCPFCGTTIDHADALISAAATSKISQACSDASYLKIMAWGLLAAIGFLFVPFIGLAGAVGLWFLRFAIPVMAFDGGLSLALSNRRIPTSLKPGRLPSS